MVELLLGNHPLDCPVCDAGGECELQDMAFSYGAPESKYTEAKNHREEQQWSPVVYFEPPTLYFVLPLCARVRRRHGRLGARGSEPRRQFRYRAQSERSSRVRRMRHVHRHLPGWRAYLRAYRYKTRPWEMKSRRHGLHALRRRLQDHSRGAPLRNRHGDRPRRQPRQERN